MLYEKTKRVLDILGATTGLFIFAPLLLGMVLVIKLTSPGPIIFSHKRLGHKGRMFEMYKFRSMVVDAEELLYKDRQLLSAYVNGNFKLENDPRVTPVGRILRRSSLDELPQLINILRGEMSLVGPRAFRPEELEQQKKKFPEAHVHVETLLTVKPGLTGPWQVSGRSEVGFLERVKLDSEYAKKRSHLHDLYILAKTPGAVLSRRGAF